VPLLYSYSYGNGIAVELFDLKDKEPFACITVNLPDYRNASECAFIDTNNCEWAEEFLVKNKIATPTGVIGFSGFCSYPEYKFDLSKLQDERGR
jgi:hypothetical protein